MKTITTGSDFSGVGSFDYAIERVCAVKGYKHKRIFACDIDKHARKTYVHNHGEPAYFPKDVYKREIPEAPLDVYMTSPPCQAFSLAGARRGKDDERGILFFNSYEFIQKNNPRFFIFENVEGLLSDDGGKTFQEWLNHLGGKSVNGLPVLFPEPHALDYHIYWEVLNAKNYGVPQNRKRVFIIGIRDDQDNNFSFPVKEHLNKKLVDILEEYVEPKYNLSEAAINSIILNENNQQIAKVNPEIAGALQSPGHACGIYKGMNAIKVKDGTNKGYTIAKLGDTISTVQQSATRRGRVGKQIAQTLTLTCSQAVYKPETIRRLTPRECFRLMGFPDSFDFSVVSDTQAYKQAGNSIVVDVLEKIITKLACL